MPTPPAGSPVAAQATRFGERLLAEGLIDEIQLNRALDAQRLSGYPLGFVMLGLGLLDEDTITVELGAHLDMPVADLRTMTVDHEVVRLVPEEFARRNVLLPIGRDNGHLAVAMVDPTNLLLLNDLRLITGLPIEPHLATRSDILANLSRIHSMRPRINEAAKSLQESRPQLRVDRSASLDLSAITASSPAVEIVNLLIMQGVRDRASDLHMEPQKEHLRIRFRIDGVLRDIAHLPSTTGAALASRIKVLADMNIVERRRAQDGQISMTVDGRELDIRVATLETIWGEKIVLRLLDRSRSLITLPQLGFSHGAYQVYHRMLHSPYGMIIVSGPTGSGKTTTLYASINELDQQVRNIMTIEDPVEYMFDNINQSQINKLADISFANGLRAILRQDPDIILVGEIRDRETAEIAVDMGIDGFLIASSVIAIVAQRLVRKVCDGCKVAYEPTAEDIDFGRSVGGTIPKQLYRGRGCSRCNMTGYYDRIGVFEVLTMSDELKRLVIARASHRELVEVATKGGMVPVRMDAWDRITAGVTTVPEVLRSVYII
ncbi:MAG: type II/IV secretion system protein [Chloroflexi bacterium]|nr:MAG: type II/IV secretion system protein [Chloroflexota bacterium]